jgi:hypothetical protein
MGASEQREHVSDEPEARSEQGAAPSGSEGPK